MTKDTQDLCPNQSDGNHRYFMFKVVEVFEPIGNKKILELSPAPIKYLGGLYEKVEYALLGCNCGSALKRVITQA